MRSRTSLSVALGAAALFAAPAHAQPRPSHPARVAAAAVRADTADTSDDADEAHEVPPRIATGVTMGAIHFASGRSDNALSFNVLLRPLPWLKISAAPGYGHTSLGRVSSSGLTDVPLGVGALHEFNDARWSPSISTSLSTTLSPGDTSTHLSLGHSAYAASAGLGISPTDQLSFWSSVEHPLSTNSGNGSMELESSYSLGRATATAGVSTEVGTPDSAAVLSRSLAGGMALKVHGPLTLTVDGSHGLSRGAPSWTLSVGFGTAYAGVSQLSPTSSFKRLRSALGGKVSATGGVSGSSSCHKTGTC